MSGTKSIASIDVEPRGSQAARMAWRVMAAGAVTPVIVGVLLRYYLVFADEPYAKWSDVFSALDLLLAPLLLTCIPFAVLALTLHGRILRTGRVGETLWGAFAGGEITTIVAYSLWWRSPDGLIELAFFLPFVIPLVPAVGMVLGLVVGWGIGRFHSPTRRVAPSP